MRISDWSSDVCSSDLRGRGLQAGGRKRDQRQSQGPQGLSEGRLDAAAVAHRRRQGPRKISGDRRIGPHDAEIREARQLKHLESIDPALLLSAYAQGIFPMSDGADDPSVPWVEPRLRAILPLDGFHLSPSLQKITANSAETTYA